MEKIENNNNKQSKNISLSENIDIRRPENTLNLHHNDTISTSLNVSDTALIENSNTESVSCDPTLDACSNNNNTDTPPGENYLTGECEDTIDNDGDGLTDVGEDPDCDEPDCFDGIDNDGDGKIDFDDEICLGIDDGKINFEDEAELTTMEMEKSTQKMRAAGKCVITA